MFVIRDDDLSAWTDVDEISQIYGEYLEHGGKVSFAVIPNAFEIFNRGNRALLYQGTERRSIDKNKQIIDYLKPYICSHQVEIMLHGYDHGYFVEWGGTRIFLDKKIREELGENRNIRFIPECCAKKKERLEKELKQGKRILEEAFNTKVKVFVPPSNGLTAEAASVIDNMRMNISGTITNKLNRKVDIYLFIAIMKKTLWKLMYRGMSYPKVIRYSNHMELTGHAFTPTTDKDGFYSQLQICEKKDYSFVLATHYWELLASEELRLDFNSIIYKQLKNNNISCLSEEFIEYE